MSINLYDQQLRVRRQREINGIALIAVSLFLAFAFYVPGARTGFLGRVFLGFGKGILGLAAYAVPPLLFYMALDFFVEKAPERTARRIQHLLFILVLLATAFHLFGLSYDRFHDMLARGGGTAKASDGLALLWTGSVNPRAAGLSFKGLGGVFGGLIALGLQRVLGQAGAVLLWVLALLIECVLLFNLSFSSIYGWIRSKFRMPDQRETEEGAAENAAAWRRLMRRRRKAADEESSAYAETGVPAEMDNANGIAGSGNGAASSEADGGSVFFPTLGQPQAAAAALETQDPAPPLNSGPAPIGAAPKGPFLDLTAVQTAVQAEGAVRADGAEVGVLGHYPEWDQDRAAKAREDSFQGIPISSFDASATREGLDLMSDHEARIAGTPAESAPFAMQADQDFSVPDFLKGGERERNTAEKMEEELDQILRQSAFVGDPLDADVRRDSPLGKSEADSSSDASVPPSIRRVEGLHLHNPLTHSSRTEETTGVGVLSGSKNSDSEGAFPPAASPSSPQLRSSALEEEMAGRRRALRGADTESESQEDFSRYRLPPITLLSPSESGPQKKREHEIRLLGRRLEETLQNFNVDARIINIVTGPAITRFELTPGAGVKVSKIVNMKDDIALSLAAVGVRIEAPIPGKSAIGIEVPNPEKIPVHLRGLIESPAFKNAKSPLTAALGRDISGAPIVLDIADMPHLLIAGATGSGKSVCINSILISLLYRCRPDELKLLMIDPKVVELSVYNGIPHLLAPVVTDPQKAANTLNWAVLEMTRRYALLAEHRVRNFKAYNELAETEGFDPLPLILLVIDELADLMMTASAEVEASIARLTALARAAGIHLIIATQRPSVDVITGVIKANIPKRIAFAVSSQVDSRTIIDMGGAEQLLGKGDMLYPAKNSSKPKRGQGAFVSNQEVEKVVSFIRAQGYRSCDKDDAEAIVNSSPDSSETSGRNSDRRQDELFEEAVDIVMEAGTASVSTLQRRLNIGHPRAGRLVDAMEDAGIVGPSDGSKPRKLLIDRSQWELRKQMGDGGDGLD